MGVILYDNIASFAIASLVLLIVWFMLSNTTKIMPEEDNETKLRIRREEVNDRSQNMSTADQEDRDISICANCGKKGDDNSMNICNKCKQVKYCNAVCKKKHRSKHKKHCDEHLLLAVKLHDEKLFKQPPPLEDCPICFQLLPTMQTGKKYKPCCGKVICSGCIYAPQYDNQGNKVNDNEKVCPFCRALTPHAGEEASKMKMKRIEAGDAIAIHYLASTYRDGINGSLQDYTKALELFHRAGKLGYSPAYHNIGYLYHTGRGVEVDNDMAQYYFELAAIEGVTVARYNLGCVEENAGNWDEAIKHYLIAVTSGYTKALNQVKHLYSNGHATKEDYTKALQKYQAYLGEIRSDQRDKAAAADEEYRYY